MKVFYLLALIVCLPFFAFSQVGIGTKKPHPSAILDITDSSKGILIPRLTNNQRLAIKTPPTGLLLFQVDEPTGFWYFDKKWTQIANLNTAPFSSGVSDYWDLVGNSGLDTSINFLGTVDSVRLSFRTNNTERMRVEANGQIQLSKYTNGATQDSVLTTDVTGTLMLKDVSAGNILVVDSLKYLYSYTGNRNIIFIKDTLRGGFFYKYEGAAPVDSGMVFSDTLSREWMRYVQDSRINVQWYATSGTSDFYAAFTKARDYVYNNNKYSTLYVPSGVYAVSQTLVFDKPIKILGEGVRYNPSSYLRFPQNTKCIFFKSMPFNYWGEIENLRIDQAITSIYDSSAHAIDAKCVLHLKNVTVDYAAGNGVNLISKDDGHDNVDGSTIEDCQFIFCNNGTYLAGGDANIVVSERNSYVDNRRWGYWDNGFLGSKNNNSHFAANAVYNTNCVVNYNGKYYVAVNSDDLINIGKDPELSPQYWSEVGSMASTAWNSSIRYWSGGPYFVTDPNAFAMIDYPYTEGFQPPARLNSRSLSLAGDQGAGIAGVHLHPLFGQLWLSSDFILPGKGTRIEVGGVGDNNSSMHIYTPSGISNNLTLEKEAGGWPAIILKRPGEPAAAAIAYNLSSELILNNGYNSMYIRPNAVTPQTDAGNSLGTSDIRWDKIYAKNHYGDWKGTFIAPVYGGTGLTSLTPYSLLTGGSTSTGNLQQIPEGSTGQILTSNGPGTLPTWQGINPGSTTAFWNLAGNSSTTTSDFLGTIDDKEFNIKTDNTLRFQLSNTGAALFQTPVNNNSTESIFRINSGTDLGGQPFDLFNMQRKGSWDFKTDAGNIVFGFNNNNQSLYTGPGTDVNFLSSGQLLANTASVGRVRGTNWYQTQIRFDIPYLEYTALGAQYVDPGTAAHQFSVVSPLTNVGTNIASFANGGSSLFTITKEGATSIGTSSPVATAQLDVSSTTKGFLPPRMTTTQRDAISSPAEGLMIYNNTTHKLNVFTGSVWEEITSMP